MKICLVVGARPNLMKVAPVIREIKKYSDIEYTLIHTGQHYNTNMSDVFFEDLDIPEPDVNLGVKSSKAAIVDLVGEIFMLKKPDIIVVFGDVDSTLYASISASKSKYKLAHVEAGIRTFDRTAPEEINRIIADILSDFLFVATQCDIDNLLKEGISRTKIFHVGDVMVDNVQYNLSLTRNIQVPEGPYILLTLHRPHNVDAKENLEPILQAISELSKKIKVIFPVHPRTEKMIRSFELGKYVREVQIIEPMRYLDFLAFMVKSKAVVTDSGGVQIETTVLNVPCITLGKSIENVGRLYTVEKGTNVPVSGDKDEIIKETLKVISGDRKWTLINDRQLFDGKASERIVKILYEAFTKK